jgi:hypothetical protein
MPMPICRPLMQQPSLNVSLNPFHTLIMFLLTDLQLNVFTGSGPAHKKTDGVKNVFW